MAGAKGLLCVIWVFPPSAEDSVTQCVQEGPGSPLYINKPSSALSCRSGERMGGSCGDPIGAAWGAEQVRPKGAERL